jgi:hypothetical protein
VNSPAATLPQVATGRYPLTTDPRKGSWKATFSSHSARRPVANLLGTEILPHGRRSTFGQRCATGKHLNSVFVSESECRCGCFVGQLGRCSIRVLGKEPQDGLDELVVGGDCHWRRIVNAAAYAAQPSGMSGLPKSSSRMDWLTRSASPRSSGLGACRMARYFPATASTAFGFVLAIASKVLAAPLVCLRPCSQP